MDEAEKMAAMKRAYAEIILNLAKESAARILVSERRAAGSQQSLVAAKEQALATLLRLKAIMDSKIKEAERASLGHIKRIQELEVQLTEAKYTINCLRTELERVNSELEKLKDNLMDPLSESDHDHATSLKDKSEDNKCKSDLTPSCPAGPGHESNSDTEQITVNQRSANGNCHFIKNATETEHPKEFRPESECPSNPDLASIIMGSKEPELYRNGCTQRIRALEQTLHAGRVPLVKTNDKCSNFKNDFAICDNRNIKKPSTVNSAVKNKTEVQTEAPPESKVTIQQANNYENGQIKCFHRVSSRKMAKCKNMTTINSGTNQENVDDESCQIHCSKISGQDNKMESGDTLFRAVDDKPQRTLNSCFAPLLIGSCINSTGRKVQMGMSLRNEVSGFLQSNKRTITRRTVKRKIHQNSDCQFSRSPASRSGDVEYEKRFIDSTSIEENDVLLTRGIQNGTGNAVQVEDATFVTPDQNVAGKLDISCCEVQPETHDALSTKFDLKHEKICEPSEASARGENDRFLKYTFRRKRKRGSAGIHDEVALPEKSNPSKRTVDEQNALPEPQKPSMARESSQDSRRMAEVARQLISLSEKRWW